MKNIQQVKKEISSIEGISHQEIKEMKPAA